jgi:hypothetical protein
VKVRKLENGGGRKKKKESTCSPTFFYPDPRASGCHMRRHTQAHTKHIRSSFTSPTPLPLFPGSSRSPSTPNKLSTTVER